MTETERAAFRKLTVLFVGALVYALGKTHGPDAALNHGEHFADAAEAKGYSLAEALQELAGEF